MERGREEFSRTEVSYNLILLNGIEDCRRARVAGNLAQYAEAVMALFDTLVPSIKKDVEPTYAELKTNVEAEVKKTREELQKLSNPLDQAGYYQSRLAGIERESTDKLYKAILKVLEDHKVVRVVAWIPSGLGA